MVPESTTGSKKQCGSKSLTWGHQSLYQFIDSIHNSCSIDLSFLDFAFSQKSSEKCRASFWSIRPQSLSFELFDCSRQEKSKWLKALNNNSDCHQFNRNCTKKNTAKFNWGCKELYLGRPSLCWGQKRFSLCDSKSDESTIWGWSSLSPAYIANFSPSTSPPLPARPLCRNICTTKNVQKIILYFGGDGSHHFFLI